MTAKEENKITLKLPWKK